MVALFDANSFGTFVVMLLDKQTILCASTITD